MSRIILNIINSVLGTDKQQYMFFHSNSLQDLDIVKTIGGQFLTFEENLKDTNKILRIISDKELSSNLELFPKLIINTAINKYDAARNLSNILKIPILNILFSIENIRKEVIFNIAAVLNEDINIFFDKKIPEQLYISKYFLINNISNILEIIEKEYPKWKPV